MAKLNHLKSLKSRLHTVQNNRNNTQRRARTQTLIQMGGLLNMVGLPQICGINDGDDLQLDLDNQDKAATLLGMLAHLNEYLFSAQNIEINNDMLDKFKQLGIKMLKDYVVQKNRA